MSALDAVLAGDRPWCLFVGLTGPHDPFSVPRKYLDMYDIGDVPLPVSYSDEMAGKPAVYRRMREQVFGQLSPREVREGIRHFWAYCTYLDELVGQLINKLDSSSHMDNTMDVYTSDHGDYCGEHGLFAKGIPCFRGAYHVSAVIRWPAVVQARNQRVDALVSLADFGPTFLEAAGLPVPAGLAGVSLLPFLRGQAPRGWRESIVTMLNGVELYSTQRSIRTEGWHYPYNGFDQDELYGLASDPHELRNLALDPGHDQTRRELCAEMWRELHALGDAAPSPYITVGLAPVGPGAAFP